MANAFVFSVNKDDILVDSGQLGQFTINGAGNKLWGRTVITDRVVNKDWGDDRFEAHTVRAEDIAKDIVDRSDEDGFFLYDGKEPGTEDISKATQKYKAACVAAVRHADAIWERTRNREAISERARRSARFIGAAPEWLDQTLTDEKKKCPRCAELIKAEATYCRFCHYDLANQKPVPASR